MGRSFNNVQLEKKSRNDDFCAFKFVLLLTKNAIKMWGGERGEIGMNVSSFSKI